jgi:gamma-glutamyltranspeptidase/glutathione hydrolase
VPVIIQQNGATLRHWRDRPSSRDLPPRFCPGQGARVGERFVLEEAARTLRLIALTTGRGVLTPRDCRSHGAHAARPWRRHDADDLADFRPEWVTPIARDYRGHTLHEIPRTGRASLR